MAYNEANHVKQNYKKNNNDTHGKGTPLDFGNENNKNKTQKPSLDLVLEPKFKKINDDMALLSNDLTNGFDEMNSAVHDVSKKVYCIYENIVSSSSSESSVASSIKNTIQGLISPNRKVIEELSNSINKLGKDIRNNNQRYNDSIKLNSIEEIVNDVKDNVSKVSASIGSVSKSLSSISETVNDLETVPTKLQDIDNRVFDIEKLLKDKNLTIKQKLPASNQDEECLMKLADYGHSVIDLLLLAARWYAREKVNLQDRDAERTRNARELEQTKTDALNEGKIAGRRELVESIIEKFDNIHSLMNADDTVSKILASILVNEGVEFKYEIGTEIEVNDENISSYEADINAVTIGKLKIISPAYIFNGKVITKAKWEKFVENNIDNVEKLQEETLNIDESNLSTINGESQTTLHENAASEIENLAIEKHEENSNNTEIDQNLEGSNEQSGSDNNELAGEK